MHLSLEAVYSRRICAHLCQTLENVGVPASGSQTIQEHRQQARGAQYCPGMGLRPMRGGHRFVHLRINLPWRGLGPSMEVEMRL
eukprot:scaffold566616_cov47-Prasinocladus_malaysianus.AAC.1